jgi:ribosome biogenesis GTPase / thiamine phosphate phosphatase
MSVRSFIVPTRAETPGPALIALGWDESYAADFAELAVQGCLPARVVLEERGIYLLHCEVGELRSEISGRLRHESARPDLPVVGDWVGATMPVSDGPAQIQAVLPRRATFSRRLSMGAERRRLINEGDVLAANVDVVFVVDSLFPEPNERRIERYLSMAWSSGAMPVVLLTKSDLCDDTEGAVARIAEIAAGVEVNALSSLTRAGLDGFTTHLRDRKTAVLLGPSGVGKSSLINALLGEERLRVNEVRGDGRGRHTTTNRQLIVLPRGGVVIDTAGLRELGLWDAAEGVGRSFAEIEALAVDCRFADCSHLREPGCAVCGAVQRGVLPAERLESYQKLQAELRHLERKTDYQARKEETRRWKMIHKSVRASGKAGLWQK